MSEPEQHSTEEAAPKSSSPLSSVVVAEHRSGAAYSADLISISRRVLYAQAAVIAMVAAIFFMAGYALGPGRDTTAQQPVEKKEIFGKSVDVSGRITYRKTAGSVANDAGAVVILIPKGSAPSDRFASEGLQPNSPGTNATALDAIKFLGGAYLVADELGEIDMQVRTGRYYVLVISNASTRREDRKIKAQDIEELERFFVDPKTLIGDQRYQWKLRKLGKNTLLNISLD
jgi:hypothetical protein